MKPLTLVFCAGVIGSALASTPVNQVTHGWCSPAVANVTGDVTINCQGIDPKIVAVLNNVLRVKDKQLTEAVNLANDWIARYQQLESSFSQIDNPSEQEKLAYELLKEGHLEEAGKLLDELIDKEDEVLKRIASTHFNRAKVYSLLFYPLKAIPHYRKAHELVPDNLEYTLELAKVLQTQRQDVEAYELFNQILKATDSDTEASPQRQLFRAEALQGVAKAHTLAQGGMDRFEEAVRYDEAAVAIYRQLNQETRGQYTFNLATAIQQLVSDMQSRDLFKSAEVEPLVYEAAGLFEQLAQENPDKEAYYLTYGMGTMLQLFVAQQINMKDLAKEPEVMNRILALHERIQKSSAQYITVEVAGSYTVVSLAYFMRLDHVNAAKAATQAIEIIEKYARFGDEYYKSLPLLYYLRSNAQKMMHQYQDALFSAQRSVDIAKQYAERDLMQFGMMLEQFLGNLAELQRMTGQAKAAENTLIESQQLNERLDKLTRSELSYQSKQQVQQSTQIHAFHILLDNEIQAKEIIHDLLQSQDVERDFTAYAKKYSIGPSAAGGGDIGWVQRNEMVKPFEDAAFALDPGKISTVPVKTQFGWHVIYVKEKK